MLSKVLFAAAGWSDNRDHLSAADGNIDIGYRGTWFRCLPVEEALANFTEFDFDHDVSDSLMLMLES
ncbi:hypothetical protein ACFS07_14910 [Undibacterium arcticum]